MCAVSPLSLLTTIFTVSSVIPVVVTTPCPLPPSVHQQLMFSEAIRHIFFPSFILKNPFHSSFGRGLHSLCVSSFSISPCSPSCSDCHYGIRWLWSGWMATPTSLTAWVAGLWWGFTSVWCVFPHVSSVLWLFVCTPSRAITGLFEMLNSVLYVCTSPFQPASGRVYVPCWRCCCCCFVAIFLLILSLNALITAPDGGISLHLCMFTLILTCYLSLIVVFHQDIFGTKTSKSPGWYTDTHTLSNTVLNILPVLLVPHPLWVWCLWCSIPTIPTTPKGLFWLLIGPGSLLYKKTLEQFCRLLNF